MNKICVRASNIGENIPISQNIEQRQRRSAVLVNWDNAGTVAHAGNFTTWKYLLHQLW